MYETTRLTLSMLKQVISKNMQVTNGTRILFCVAIGKTNWKPRVLCPKDMEQMILAKDVFVNHASARIEG